MTKEKFDVYSHVTDQIVAQIEAGTPPWRKPWTGGGVSVSLPEWSCHGLVPVSFEQCLL
jgi:antirestriction protein ArdC